MPPVRAALIGYGYAGRTFHAPLIRAAAGMELVAIGSGDEAKVHADLPGLRVEADPQALIADPAIDLIVIATPNATHAPLAGAALAAGRPVVVDKPFTLDMSEARALIALAERHGRLLSIFHNRRWDSDFLTVRAAIDDGAIGDVRTVESRFDRFRPAVRDRWRERAAPGGGIWFDLGPHLVDQALQLFGLPDRVQGNLARQRDGAEVDDWAHVVLDQGERRVILHASMLVAGGSPRFVAHGTAGSLVKAALDRQEAQLLAGMAPGAPGWGEDPDPLHIFDGTDERIVPARPGDQRAYYAGVAAAIRGQAANPVPPIEALAVMAVIEAAARSAASGKAAVPALSDAERAAFARTR